MHMHDWVLCPYLTLSTLSTIIVIYMYILYIHTYIHTIHIYIYIYIYINDHCSYRHLRGCSWASIWVESMNTAQRAFHLCMIGHSDIFLYKNMKF